MTAPFLVVVDPNWSADSGGGGRGADSHYELADTASMAIAYRRSPPWRDVGPGLLWLWATTLAFSKGDAHTLCRTLGFRPCASFVWCKVDPAEGYGFLTGHDVALPGAWTPPARMGLGQWQRTEHEHLLLARRGDVKVPPPGARQRSVVYAPRGEHSAKPEEAWRVIEATSRGSLGDDVVGVEFNARVQRAGWIACGRLDGEDAPVVVRGP